MSFDFRSKPRSQLNEIALLLGAINTWFIKGGGGGAVLLAVGDCSTNDQKSLALRFAVAIVST